MRNSLILTTALLFGQLASASAQTTSFEGSLRELCSDSDGSKHPKKLVVDQLVANDAFADQESVRLLLAYEPGVPDPAGRGKLTATLTLERVDGTIRKLGKMSAVQNRVSGAIQAQSILDEPLDAGDSLRWNLKFKKFGKLAAGECFLSGGLANLPPESCGPFPDSATSEYVLPYRTGQTSVISQPSCGSGSHQGVAKHSVDFALPVGTEVVASRAGTVFSVEDSRPEETGRVEDDNILVLEHDDGTFTRYVHIAQNGALVSVGEAVEQGQPVALSGNAGSTSGLPHLHFEALTCPNRNDCGTLPVSFRNTRKHPQGLELGQAYVANSD